jgi:hypothetical protein
VVWKVFLFGSAALFVMKLLFQTRLRQWGAKLDQAVNLTLILLVISYAVFFAWQWIKS